MTFLLHVFNPKVFWWCLRLGQTNKQIRVHALCNSQWNITISEDSTITKAHSLCKQCLHNLHFLKKGSFSPNLSKLARADISCHLIKNKILVQNCLLNKWILGMSSRSHNQITGYLSLEILFSVWMQASSSFDQVFQVLKRDSFLIFF